VIVSYGSGGDVLQEWFLENLKVARAVLAEYPLLNSIFQNFKDYERKNYRIDTKNMVLLLCLPETPKDESIERLTAIENAIKRFDILHMTKAMKNDCLAKLTSDNYIDSSTKVTELEIAYTMANRFGDSSVEIFPELTNGKISDVLLRLNGKEIYFEVDNLGERLFELKIKKILTSAEKHVEAKNEEMGYMKITVDTTNFVFDQDIIDESKSSEKLKNEIDMLALDKLSGFEGVISLKTFGEYVINRKRFEEIRELGVSLSPVEENLLKNSHIQRWLNNFNNKHLGDVQIIKSLGCRRIEGGGTNVQVRPNNDFFSTNPRFTSSKAASVLDRDAVINQIVRKAGSQIDDDEQIEPEKPNIIMIKAVHWLVFISEPECLPELKKKMMEFFRKRKEKHLSGVAVFGTNIDETIFIENPFAAESSKLEKEEINKLGFHWVASS